MATKQARHTTQFREVQQIDWGTGFAAFCRNIEACQMVWLCSQQQPVTNALHSLTGQFLGFFFSICCNFFTNISSAKFMLYEEGRLKQ